MAFTRRGKEAAKEIAQIYSLLAPLIIFLFIFCYIPMYGVIIAFQNYVPGLPFIGKGVEWVGLKWILRFIRGEYFWRLIRNTLVLSGLNLAFGFTIPIAFALLLDQIKRLRFRKFVQTASYLPYFISTVIVAGMVLSFINTDGIITKFLTLFGFPIQNWRLSKNAFPVIYTITNTWKGFGFGSILYLSTITSIDPGLYESAKIDGANRFQQIIHITLPGIQRIIAINLIMAIGGILGTNSELILNLYHAATYETADVIGTYTYRLGILGGEYSYTTAVGLFMSFFAFLLTFTANKVSNKLTDFGLW
ncbi:MAG: ABC transporter permease subunit [Spirochaetaceae bacterium]|jgi:putative aldouronate transport system permease protein|nr:ABC transporter permease subunit [Spirochaetaceae bacterium]